MLIPERPDPAARIYDNVEAEAAAVARTFETGVHHIAARGIPEDDDDLAYWYVVNPATLPDWP